MKTQTIVIGGLVLGGIGYYLYVHNKTQPMVVTGMGGNPQTIQVDGNMTAQEMADTSSKWNALLTADDVAGAQSLINSLSGASHPKAAAALSALLQAMMAKQQNAPAAQGFDAGALIAHRMMMAGAL